MADDDFDLDDHVLKAHTLDADPAMLTTSENRIIFRLAKARIAELEEAVVALTELMKFNERTDELRKLTERLRKRWLDADS